MREREEKKPLPIPENCPPVRYPFVKGFTSTDSCYVVGIGALAVVVAIIVYIRTENIFALVGIVVFCITTACTVFYRDVYAENMIDKVRILKEHVEADKHFIYYYRDIYGWVDSSEIWRNGELEED